MKWTHNSKWQENNKIGYQGQHNGLGISWILTLYLSIFRFFHFPLPPPPPLALLLLLYLLILPSSSTSSSSIRPNVSLLLCTCTVPTNSTWRIHSTIYILLLFCLSDYFPTNILFSTSYWSPTSKQSWFQILCEMASLVFILIVKNVHNAVL